MRIRTRFAIALLVVLAVLIAVDWLSGERKSRHQTSSGTAVQDLRVDVSTPATLPDRANNGQPPSPADPVISRDAQRDHGRAAIQRAPDLRIAALNFARSNEMGYAVAALSARLYCTTVGGLRDQTAAAHATGYYFLAPTLRGQLAVSDASKRIEAVEAARRRCRFGDDGPAEWDRLMREGSPAAMTAYLDLLKDLRALPALDLRTLSSAQREALYAPDPTVLLSALSQALFVLPDRKAGTEPDSEAQLAATLATDLAACQLGDLCTPDSFRMAEVCLHWGACDGRDLPAAIERLLSPRPDLRALTQKYAETLLTAVRAGRP